MTDIETINQTLDLFLKQRDSALGGLQVAKARIEQLEAALMANDELLGEIEAAAKSYSKVTGERRFILLMPQGCSESATEPYSIPIKLL